MCGGNVHLLLVCGAHNCDLLAPPRRRSQNHCSGEQTSMARGQGSDSRRESPVFGGRYAGSQVVLAPGVCPMRCVAQCVQLVRCAATSHNPCLTQPDVQPHAAVSSARNPSMQAVPHAGSRCKHVLFWRLVADQFPAFETAALTHPERPNLLLWDVFLHVDDGLSQAVSQI